MDDLVPWERADVQWVYELICEPPAPPNTEEHWEGYLARTIVTRFAARAAKLEAERDHAWNMVAKADAATVRCAAQSLEDKARADRLDAMLKAAGAIIASQLAALNEKEPGAEAPDWKPASMTRETDNERA
jgi:hypothetical protein